MNVSKIDEYTFDLILIVVCSQIKFVRCSIATAYDTKGISSLFLFIIS